MRNENGNLIFDTKPKILSYASVAGKKEGEGPLREHFDRIIHDSYVGKNTFEQGESELTHTAVDLCLSKAKLKPTDIDLAYCGDLLNQCVASSFAMRDYPIPYAGVYSACSTMALALTEAAVSVESGAARHSLCAVSSHYCTAERQYRMPLEYGSQRPPTAQWTVTGSGAVVLAKTGKTGELPYISSARIGKIVDYSVTDQNNMGAAMAPAAADTIYEYLSAANTEPYDYDMIFTGDLGRVGTRLLHDLMKERGVDLGTRHSDCGMMIFGENQDVHAGGSGCGCCATVLCGYILNTMRTGKLKNILFVPTGALLSPTTVMQKESIPSIAHLVNIRI